jgi:hypothetical protein
VEKCMDATLQKIHVFNTSLNQPQMVSNHNLKRLAAHLKHNFVPLLTHKHRHDKINYRIVLTLISTFAQAQLKGSGITITKNYDYTNFDKLSLQI